MKKIFVLCVLLLCMPMLLSAFVLNGRKWFSGTSFYYNGGSGPNCCLTASERQNQITGGLNAWGTISYGGTTSATGARADGTNAVSWAKLGGTTLGVTSYITTDTSQTQACNGTTFYKFVEVDVRFNNGTAWQNSNSCTNGFDLSGVATHEFGHAVGLGHTSISSATMYYAVSPCDFTKSSLENDDRNGYNYIYSCGGGGGGGGGKPGGGHK